MQNVVINITITAPIVVGLALGACALLSRGRVAAALCVAGLLTALTGLTIGVHTHGWVTGLDAATASRFAAHPTYRFYVASLAIAHLASPAATAAAGLIAGALLSWRARSVIPGVVVIGTVGAAALAQTALKAAVRRPASPAELPFPLVRYDHPFPSGHVTGTAALLGIVAVCVGVGRTRTLRAWLAGSGVVGVLVVAVTRLYLGVHWLTDAVGGAVLGGVFVTMGAAVFSALHARSRPEGTTPPVIAPTPAPRYRAERARPEKEQRVADSADPWSRPVRTAVRPRLAAGLTPLSLHQSGLYHRGSFSIHRTF